LILIVAYGNSLRRDDGAGFFLADALERIWRKQRREVERIDTHQLMPEIAEDVAADGVAAVVFADARVADPLEGDGLRIQVRRIGTDVRSPSVGHHLDPTVVMLYARLLYGKDPPAWVATVPGVDFEHGEGLSETARSALDLLPDVLSGLGSEWPLESSGKDH
jgi:hydrogenase maturation protease